VYPILVVLLDGLGDRAHDVLGGKTGNEAAATPNLDRLCAGGSCGVLFALGPGRAPASELAHWAMLGYRPDEFPGRAVFEAYGRGIPVTSREDVYAYAALRPAELRDGELWLTGRPDPDTDGELAEQLIQRCNRIEIDELTFDLRHVWRGEAICRIEGRGADDRITDTDAFFRAWHPVLRPRALVPEAVRTANVVEAWTRDVLWRLQKERFNVITLKWYGRERDRPTFLERHGVTGTFIGDSTFLRGLALSIGLREVHEPETNDPVDDIRRRLALARERLDAGETFVFVHQKTTDAAGHTKNPEIKRDTIAQLDAAFDALPTDRAIVCVTGDHATPCTPDVIHSGDPVPFVLAGPGVRADEVTEFGELPCSKGVLGHLRGPDMMPVLLNAADRPLFLGSRPTPFDAADGYPALLEPLRI
jgi:2,3-bisphosphoglycerate-independent phosphoglycerate mutase